MENNNVITATNGMRKLLILSFSLCFSMTLMALVHKPVEIQGQRINYKHDIVGNKAEIANPILRDAYQLAIWTIDNNTDENKLLKAGGNYGGEWTRDIAINSWNAASLIRPDVAEHSLWSVTNNRQTIGHQYWDKIIWVIAAWNHYLMTGNEQFLTQAYECSKNTMVQLEDSVFDQQYGLFTGPAVYQDGITAYDEPIYDPNRDNISYVLDHPNSHTIKCLSTNAVYYEAYLLLAEMAKIKEPGATKTYLKKAAALKKNFRKHLYNKETGKLYYLIDHTGKKHEYTEALGVAYAIMFGLVSKKEAKVIISNIYQSENGIPCVYPSFPRHAPDKPGRHNVMIWPHVNMFYASACATVGEKETFWFEVKKTAELAINADKALKGTEDGAQDAKANAKAAPGKPKGNFHEIYTIEGIPFGGYQCSHPWPPLNHQTWCATGYLRAFYYHVCGMQPSVKGMNFAPIGMYDGSEVTLKNITYRKAVLNITVRGNGGKVKKCTINGVTSKPFIPANAAGSYNIVLEL